MDNWQSTDDIRICFMCQTKVWSSAEAGCSMQWVSERASVGGAIPVWCLWRQLQRSCVDWAAELNCCNPKPVQTYPQTCGRGGERKRAKTVIKRLHRREIRMNEHCECLPIKQLFRYNQWFQKEMYLISKPLNCHHVAHSRQTSTGKIQQHSRYLPSHYKKLVDLFLC